ncbi:hypothetical protein G1H11_04300 [Phytoactinopolyspora alkaliphila]|uniref:Uncharacterized protein n=1 Tax=Phytoactinopolyspora alkaliphila TaxID=1783498 RepID=A0A6N9YHV5_9ACTN|nr:hypothetical protein [Phytoactinopolyspora alkaliphila]NED94527.1 hypothetical protein [Phytoactinopolyspora alkaliphila]
MEDRRMWSRLLAGTGAAALAAAAGFALLGGASSADEAGELRAKVTASVEKSVIAEPSPVDDQPAEAVYAEPEEPGDEGLVLSAPEEANGWDEVPFSATWTADGAQTIVGTVDLQQLDGESWTTVADLDIGAAGGETELEVGRSGIYRLAYGGGDTVEATSSNDVAVVSGELMESWITATAAPAGDDAAEITATWTTKGGVAIVGELELQRLVDDEWEPVSTVTTGADSTAELEIDASIGDRFRFVYPGGSRFEAVESDDAVVIGADVRTIPVSTCQNGTDIDNLPYGAACHYAPVTVDTFVVAHDYLGNAWWNAMPMGTVVELEGREAGIYEVVDRTIAPGRGSALGAASNWACGDACDVILQTCQGSNTGFTWLRKID